MIDRIPLANLIAPEYCYVTDTRQKKENRQSCAFGKLNRSKNFRN
jgi:hypothetical protein